MRQKVDKAGEIKKNNQGYLMKIIKYLEYHNILIKFLDDKGTIVKGDYSAFQKGMIKNPYHKTVYNIGCIGETDTIDNNKKRKKSYYCWKGMLHRCYDENFHKKQPTYKDCTVCEEWHNFQNFAKWYEDNYYEVKGETMCLDKDILLKGNKIYSSETCIFAPQRINKLFTKNNKNRGDYLIGVSKISNPNSLKQYQATLTCLNKTKCFKTEIEAFNWYKEEKEKLIKKVADEYKYKIPQKLYVAMINWKVEIND